VERVVGDRALRALVPDAQGLEQRLAALRHHEVHDGGRAAGEPRGGAGLEVVGRDRAATGSARCTCGSTKPGNTKRPEASSTSSRAERFSRSGPTARIVPPST